MAYRLRSAESYIVVHGTSTGVSCGLLQTVLSRDPWVIRLHRETVRESAGNSRALCISRSCCEQVSWGVFRVCGWIAFWRTRLQSEPIFPVWMMLCIWGFVPRNTFRTQNQQQNQRKEDNLTHWYAFTHVYWIKTKEDIWIQLNILKNANECTFLCPHHAAIWRRRR
jgi:hypothetical protein